MVQFPFVFRPGLAVQSTSQHKILWAKTPKNRLKTHFFQDFIVPRSPASASQRGSLASCSQEQDSVLRFRPQRGQSPLQSGLHSVLAGRDKSTCSRSTSSSNRLSF